MSKRIVIVEDDEEIRFLLQEIFAETEYEVEMQSNGTRGYYAVEKNGADLMMVDISLPDITGLSLIGRVRSLFPRLPAIVMTAYDTPAYRDHANQLKVNAFVSKPFGRDELLAAVKDVLSTSCSPRLQ